MLYLKITLSFPPHLRTHPMHPAAFLYPLTPTLPSSPHLPTPSHKYRAAPPENHDSSDKTTFPLLPQQLTERSQSYFYRKTIQDAS